MGRHRANERLLDGSPGKIEARASRPIHGPIEATRPMRFAARRLLRRDSRVVGGAMVRTGPAFGTASLQRIAPGAIKRPPADLMFRPYRSLVQPYVGRISTNDLVTSPNALIEEPIGD